MCKPNGESDYLLKGKLGSRCETVRSAPTHRKCKGRERSREAPFPFLLICYCTGCLSSLDSNKQRRCSMGVLVVVLVGMYHRVMLSAVRSSTSQTSMEFLCPFEAGQRFGTVEKVARHIVTQLRTSRTLL